MYEDVRNAADSPEKAVLDFLESVYQAGTKRANRDTEAFRLPSSETQFKKQSQKQHKEPADILNWKDLRYEFKLERSQGTFSFLFLILSL